MWGEVWSDEVRRDGPSRELSGQRLGSFVEAVCGVVKQEGEGFVAV